MKNLSATTLRVLTELDAARLEGREWVELKVGHGHKAFEKMAAAHLIDEGPGGVYRITHAGSLALAKGEIEGAGSNGRSVRPYTRRANTPAATNGHVGEHPRALPCAGDCAHRRVLEIVASRYPPVRALLDAVDQFEEETK